MVFPYHLLLCDHLVHGIGLLNVLEKSRRLFRREEFQLIGGAFGLYSDLVTGIPVDDLPFRSRAQDGGKHIARFGYAALAVASGLAVLACAVLRQGEEKAFTVWGLISDSL